MQERQEYRPDEGILPSQTGIDVWLPRLDLNQ